MQINLVWLINAPLPDMKTVKDCAQVFVTALAVAHQEILDGAAREK
jgi:hypothetical protein